MKIIVLGGTGMLGQSLCRQAKFLKYDCLSVARKNADINLDITDDNKIIHFLEEQKPDVIINACAIVNHKLCDDNPSLAYITNARPSSILSEISEKLGCKYIFISFPPSQAAHRRHTGSICFLIFFILATLTRTAQSACRW